MTKGVKYMIIEQRKKTIQQFIVFFALADYLNFILQGDSVVLKIRLTRCGDYPSSFSDKYFADDHRGGGRVVR